jgi:hypothetical protein
MQPGFSLRGVKIGKTEDGTETMCKRYGIADPRDVESLAAIGRCRDYLSDMERSTACNVQSASILAVAVLKDGILAGDVEGQIHTAMKKTAEVVAMKTFAQEKLVPPMIAWEVVEGKAGQNEVFLDVEVAQRARSCVRPTAGTEAALEAAVRATTRAFAGDGKDGARQEWVRRTIQESVARSKNAVDSCQMPELYDNQLRLVRHALGAIALHEGSIEYIIQPNQVRQHAKAIRERQERLAGIDDLAEAQQFFGEHLSVKASAAIGGIEGSIDEQVEAVEAKYLLAHDANRPEVAGEAATGAGGEAATGAGGEAAEEAERKRARKARKKAKKRALELAAQESADGEAATGAGGEEAEEAERKRAKKARKKAKKRALELAAQESADGADGEAAEKAERKRARKAAKKAKRESKFTEASGTGTFHGMLRTTIDE